MTQIWVLYENREKAGFTRKGREAAIELANKRRTGKPSATFAMYTGQEGKPLALLWNFPPLNA